MARSTVFFIIQVLALLPVQGGEVSLLSVDRSDPKILRVKVSPVKASATGLLEVIESSTGHCVKTLHAGMFSKGQTFLVKTGEKLPPGKYRIRYREDISISPIDSLVPSGNRTWTNPTDFVITANALFVLDSGRAPPREVELDKPLDPAVDEQEKGTAFIYKFHHDKTPDVSFGDEGRIGPLLGPRWDKLSRWSYHGVHCITADQDGKVYLSSIYHDVLIFDASGRKLEESIGGWDSDPLGPVCTTWVNSTAMGPENRIYIPSSYNILRVYDRTKKGFAGILYSAALPNGIGVDRVITSDGKGTFYLINRLGHVEKFTDTGKEIKQGYFSDSSVQLVNPTGPSASGDLIWVASHGGAPLWDSDAGEVALFWDTGDEIQMVERYGSPGITADKVQFMNPSSLVQTPDHLELWVVEDGMINEEGPPGNARIRKFKIASARSEEIAVEVQ